MKKTVPLIILSLLLAISCKEEIEHFDQNKNPTELYLKFESHRELEAVTNSLAMMTEEELNSWETQRSFTSYRTTLNRANEAWQLLTTEEEKLLFEEEYADILSVKDDSIVPKIDIRLYQIITNREGIYGTGDFLNKVSLKTIYSVKSNEYWKLNELKLSEIDGIKVIPFSAEHSINNGKIKAACLTMNTASYFYNQSNCRNDREVYISGKSYYVFSTTSEGDWRQPRVEIKVWGKIRSGTWCNWSGYNTILAYQSVSFVLMGWTFQNSVATPTSYERILPDYAPINERISLVWDQPIGDKVLNLAITAQPFTRLHAEGTSRAVEGNYAILDCQ